MKIIKEDYKELYEEERGNSNNWERRYKTIKTDYWLMMVFSLILIVIILWMSYKNIEVNDNHKNVPLAFNCKLPIGVLDGSKYYNFETSGSDMFYWSNDTDVRMIHCAEASNG